MIAEQKPGTDRAKEQIAHLRELVRNAYDLFDDTLKTLEKIADIGGDDVDADVLRDAIKQVCHHAREKLGL
jgi:hypothetical protein